MALLEINHLNFTYAGVDVPALKDISLDIEQGDFVVLCGASGCGKTTLLKLLKRQVSPSGERTGEIRYGGEDVQALDERRSVSEIGYVMQDPDAQIVTDQVWHELAFGLESLGERSAVIRRRVAEIVGFFGIGDFYNKRTCELSGGQKQLLNLASIMVMRPRLLVLDEPTAQLDPIAAANFLASLKKVNEELGITVLLAEHRWEEVFSIANKVVLMKHAGIRAVSTPRALCEHMAGEEADALGLPTAVRMFRALGAGGECPLTVREARRYVRTHFGNEIDCLELASTPTEKNERVLEVKGAYFRYERQLPDVLRGLDLTVYRGEILGVLGANGAGKTTLLRVLSGLLRPYRGKVTVFGNGAGRIDTDGHRSPFVAYLPQHPQALFVHSCIRQDWQDAVSSARYDKQRGEQEIARVAGLLGIEYLGERHPYDLSGGELQKAAIAKLLLTDSDILLLDEPTKGLDAHAKASLASILHRLREQGKTVVVVTHDVEFAAEYTDRCAMFFDGQIVSAEPSVDFFSHNHYYTTSAARIGIPYYKNTVTADMLIRLCRQNGIKEVMHER